MNDKLKEQLVQFLGSILTGLEKGAGFVIEQAPDVVREYVTLCRVDYTFWTVFGLLMAVICLTSLFRKIIPTLNKTDDYDLPRREREAICNVWVPLLIMSIVGGIAGTIIFFSNVSLMLKAWFAPRILVIEWIKGLIG